MKKLNYLLFVCLFAFGAVLTSCGEDDEITTLEITFANGDNSVTLAEGRTTHEVNATITSSAGLKEVKWFDVTSDGADEIDKVDNFNNNNKNSYAFRETFTAYDDRVIRIQAVDANGKQTERNFTINVTKAPVNNSADINIWTSRILGAQGNAQGSSCASVDGKVYTQSAAAANIREIDFIYHYQNTGANNLAQLVSPAAAVLDWLPANGKNETKFTAPLSISTGQYNSISETEGSDLIEEHVTVDSATEVRAGHLKAGDYIGFITQGGKKGIIKVEAQSGTTAGTITIEIKVLK